MKKQFLPLTSVLTSVMLISVIISTPSFAKTVASVNGVNIDDAIIKENLSKIPAEFLKGKQAEIEKTLLEKIIEQEVVKQEAEKQKIQETSEYKKQLKTIKNSLSSSLLVKKIVTEAVTDTTIKAAFEENKDKFTAPGVKARHILVKTKKEAEDIITELKNGKDFAKLAEKKSIGPSSKKGGDLGWFKSSDMVQPFSEVAFTLAKGNFNKTPVQTKFGWHVILVEDKNEKMEPKFSLVKQQIEEAMQQKIVIEYLAQLKASAKIEYK